MKDTFAKFEAKFADLGLDEKTLQIGHDKTIVPQNKSYRSTREVMNSLPRMSVDGDNGLGGDLKIKGKIGAGGMGMVRLAEQAPLDRLVAVKSPLAGREEGAVNSLLQEAELPLVFWIDPAIDRAVVAFTDRRFELWADDALRLWPQLSDAVVGATDNSAPERVAP